MDKQTHLRITGQGNHDVVIVPMLTTELERTTGYPVTAYNCQRQKIGIAANDANYVQLWNSDPANKCLGELFQNNGTGVSFKLVLELRKRWIALAKDSGIKILSCAFGNTLK